MPFGKVLGVIIHPCSRMSRKIDLPNKAVFGRFNKYFTSGLSSSGKIFRLWGVLFSDDL